MIFENMKIKTELFISFLIVILFLIMVGGFGIFEINLINRRSADTYSMDVRPLETLERLKSEYAGLRRTQISLMSLGAYEDLESIETANQINHNQLASLRAAIQAHMDRLEEAGAPQIQKDEVNEFLAGINDVYYPSMVKTYEYALASDIEAIESMRRFLAPYGSDLTVSLDRMFERNMTHAANNTREINSIASRAYIIMIILCVLAVSIACVLSYSIGSSTSESIGALRKAAKEIAMGHLDLGLSSDAQNEFGDLTRDLSAVADTLGSITSDLSHMGIMHEEYGDIEVFLDEEKYRGAYNAVARNINAMARGHIHTQENVMACLAEIANGNFEAVLETLPGKKAVFNETTEEIRKNIKDVGEEIKMVLSEARKGNLSAKAGTDKYIGDWGSLINELNDLLDTLVMPINEASKVLAEIAGGNFQARVKGSYKGDLALIKDSVNNTAMRIASYINDKLEAERAAHLAELTRERTEAESRAKGSFLPL